MNNKILKTLEFDLVKAKLEPFLATEQGKNELRNLQIFTNADKIQEEFSQLAEFEEVISQNGPLNILHTKDISEILKRLQLQASLSGPEFLRIKRVISTLGRIKQYFKEATNIEFPSLGLLLDKIFENNELVHLLSIFDDSGALLDTASSKLYELRTEIRQEQSAIDKIMQDMLNHHAADLTENLITIRNDRKVLPVSAGNKSKIPGVVHDISSSGATLFIEPNAAVTRNNNLNQKRIEEKNEVSRIFMELSDKLITFLPDLKQASWVIGKFDLIKAKSEFMRRNEAIIPSLAHDHDIQIYQARHPLIEANKVVRNDILFSNDLNSIVITGPNTGGKTITIKTLGILTLMAQSGLPVTAGVGTKIALFDEIFADIGDEQSIEQSLSTFSSHMLHIIEILTKANKNSLVLFDELGAGTDPKEGAALATAILEELRSRKIKTLSTTHYPELKAYGLETEGVQNASMEFDIENMRPTYRLRLGVPGRSNAIEISRRLGLSESVIEAAKVELNDNETDINGMIERLESQVHSQEEATAEIKRLKLDSEKINKQLISEQRALEREKDKLIDSARTEAAEIAGKAREEAQAILKQLNEKMQLKPHEVIAGMAELDKLIPDLSKNRVLKKAKASRGLIVGAEVLVTSFGQHGRIIRLEKDGRWQVLIGSITAIVDESDLEILQTVEKPSTKLKNISRRVSTNIKAQLDLRGTRYEEASLEIDNYIDQALLTNLSTITIVHGIGTGVIRELVKKKLQANKHVKSFEYAPMNAGGSGATIAQLK
ncbi:endonuclease MutS2 [Lactovum miscens]|uniref:Endonuclease MutS2 n=1 Tax=Lactovum miscens TaxID=190387 RepID=A0A841C997_9LACT|nr:endonuclease MutS2 [Lactovum miscens]MBB5888131.1 DNA mismatch repair protein MutS2 [Lactovum miscens]